MRSCPVAVTNRSTGAAVLPAEVERSNAKVRAHVCSDKLAALGFVGSQRTVRRAVAEVEANYHRGRRRVYPPFRSPPGMWVQWD